jgi:hypothetical protein
MRPRPLTRLATTLLGLLYLLAWGEPVAWHPCPMHDGTGMHAVTTAVTTVGAPTGHAGAHADHLAAAPASVQDAAPAPDDADGHACQCLGHGCCPAGVLAPTVQAVRWRVLVARRAEPPAPTTELARAVAPRLLPFANGPPRLA